MAEEKATSLTLSQLESRLWAAANSLRGPVDPADFKSYVFPLLFFKWVSDTWDLDHAAAVADFGEDLDRRGRGGLPPLRSPRRMPLG